MVEIARALKFDAEIVIMDEPTSALADSEVARLFRVIADLRRAGTTVLYISHKMNEIFELADRVVVLRTVSSSRVPRVERPHPARLCDSWSVARSRLLTTSSTRSERRCPGSRALVTAQPCRQRPA